MTLQSAKIHSLRKIQEAELNILNNPVIVGPNNAGKSSVLLLLHYFFNKISDDMLLEGRIPRAIAEMFESKFKGRATRGRRLALTFGPHSEEFFVTFDKIGDSADFTRIYIHKRITRTLKHDRRAARVLMRRRADVRMLFIPAIRDPNDPEFASLFQNTLQSQAIDAIMPRERSGTRREYRTLKNAFDTLKGEIEPYLQTEVGALLQERLGSSFSENIDVEVTADHFTLSEWIRSNTQIVEKSPNAGSIPLSASGTGIQSAVMLALSRIQREAAQQENVHFIIAIEEPEAFLHPQLQLSVLSEIAAASTSRNVSTIMTTHSPYVVSQVDFSQISVMRPFNRGSRLIHPAILPEDLNSLNRYSTEVNAKIFFCDTVVFVEGETDQVVLSELLRKAKRFDVSVITVDGKEDFKNKLKLARSLKECGISAGIIADVDAVAVGSRAVFKALEGYGILLPQDQVARMQNLIDAALASADYSKIRFVLTALQKAVKKRGLNLYVFAGDLEYALVSKHTRPLIRDCINRHKDGDKIKFRSLRKLRRGLGSKGAGGKEKASKPSNHALIVRDIAKGLSRPYGELDACFTTVTGSPFPAS